MTADSEKTPANAGPDHPEDVAGETAPAAEAPAAPVSPDSDAAAQLKGEVASLKDQLLRAVAETENVRRRAEREREDTAKYAIARFAKELLAVGDNLRRALESVPAEQRAQNDMLNTVVVGVEATERQLAAAFERVGIKKLEPLGLTFDPNLHQVMFEVEHTGKAPGTVVQVLQDGYMLHDRLLREALVGVAKQGSEPAGHVDTTA